MIEKPNLNYVNNLWKSKNRRKMLLEITQTWPGGFPVSKLDGKLSKLK